MSANDIQVGGDHYGTSDNQPWDFIERHGLGYLEGNIVKYVSRWWKKSGIEDLQKVKHYIDKLEELHVHEGRVARSKGAGRTACRLYFEANGIIDFREMILISTFASEWSEVSFNQAQLLLDSLILGGVDGRQNT